MAAIRAADSFLGWFGLFSVIFCPFFAGGGMRTNAKDHQIASDKYLGGCLLVPVTLEVGAGVDRVPTRPSGGTEKRIETVGVGSLVGVGDR